MQKKSMKNFQGYKIWEKAATYHLIWLDRSPVLLYQICLLDFCKSIRVTIYTKLLKSCQMDIHRQRNMLQSRECLWFIFCSTACRKFFEHAVVKNKLRNSQQKSNIQAMNSFDASIKLSLMLKNLQVRLIIKVILCFIY